MTGSSMRVDEWREGAIDTDEVDFDRRRADREEAFVGVVIFDSMLL
jgi:hypothetical protein